MTIYSYLITAVFALAPISELRGAIPFALNRGMHPAAAYFYCVSLNALISPLVFLFLSTIHKYLFRYNWYKNFFNKIVEKSRHKIENRVAKYGYMGIALFVAVPLPITGAYTGTLGAWILGLNPRKTFFAVLAGVTISGLIVSAIMLLGIEALSFFIKEL